MKHHFLSAPLVALALAFTSPVLAAPSDPTPTQQSETTEAQPDDGELSNFVAAFVRLIGVQHGYMMIMQDEEDPNRLESIKRDALDDMTTAVEQDGLSVDRYNEIALAVRDDPNLQGRVEAILQQLASDPSAEQPAPEEE
ncbi:MAG: DUF4168 domain-containing protein [Rhodospirillaceae bacterium]|nr:DUF4168 domain-containing protein [Rhodospirillales bacterium]